MNPILPIVMGSVVFCYVHSFNRISKLYRESGYTMDWSDLVKNTVYLSDAK